MVRTPINLVRGLIRLGLIKHLNLSFEPFPMQPFKGLQTVMTRLSSLIRLSLICLRTKLFGVPTIGLPAVIMFKTHLNQQSTDS